MHSGFFHLYTLQTFTYSSIQPIGDYREPNSIHQIGLQLVSTRLIGTLNQVDQFENVFIY